MTKIFFVDFFIPYVLVTYIIFNLNLSLGSVYFAAILALPISLSCLISLHSNTKVYVSVLIILGLACFFGRYYGLQLSESLLGEFGGLIIYLLCLGSLFVSLAVFLIVRPIRMLRLNREKHEYSRKKLNE